MTSTLADLGIKALNAHLESLGLKLGGTAEFGSDSKRLELADTQSRRSQTGAYVPANSGKYGETHRDTMVYNGPSDKAEELAKLAKTHGFSFRYCIGDKSFKMDEQSLEILVINRDGEISIEKDLGIGWYRQMLKDPSE